ncbi:MAG: ribbon-helix-helix protein, CopG family [Solirubrobacterales bacterium]|nr:ribbon-helix-helix protein, CopG family [Solirubrobacterales bacterium]
MKKTSIYLEPEIDRAIARLAAAEGRSKSAIIREALARRAEDAPSPPRITAIGIGEGPGDLADHVDRYAREALVEEQ